jgi:protein gp37
MTTKIEWCEETWNPVTGCSPISEGCAHCYAQRMAKRLAGRYGYPKDDPFRVTFHEDRLDEPRKWRKPRMVFVCSMGDLFHEDVDLWHIDDIIDTCMAASQHIYLFLTKRPENIKTFLDAATPRQVKWMAKRAWLGVTAENQARADERVPILLQIPAAVHFVSIEPMLGPVDLNKRECLIDKRRFKYTLGNYLDWVILGGETGPGARPMHPEWARSVRDQCVNAGVPFFFKSWGEWRLKGSTDFADKGSPIGFGVLAKDGEWFDGQTGWNGRSIDPDTGEAYMNRVGKKTAGRLLDGREWNEYPEVEHTAPERR